MERAIVRPPPPSHGRPEAVPSANSKSFREGELLLGHRSAGEVSWFSNKIELEPGKPWRGTDELQRQILGHGDARLLAATCPQLDSSVARRASTHKWTARSTAVLQGEEAALVSVAGPRGQRRFAKAARHWVRRTVQRYAPSAPLDGRPLPRSNFPPEAACH